MDPLYPLLFKPILKERVWGGRRLEELYGKPLPPNVPIGESWEISDRPGDVSVVANGSLAGKDLHWLVHNFTQPLMGGGALLNGRFPLLIKILDARERLSLQVHPPPQKAAGLGGEPKTELWFLADAKPNAQLFVGLRRGCTRDKFVESIEAGTVADCFHCVPVRAGDAMFLPSGRVHAIGEGTVIFEIQQNSDTTYRVFDWNRQGLDGKPRALHIQESLESIDFNDFEPSLVRPQPQTGAPQIASLVRDPLFVVEQVTLDRGEDFTLSVGAMQILGVVAGALAVKSDSQELLLSAGQFSLLPASLPDVALRAVSAVTCLRVLTGGQKAL